MVRDGYASLKVASRFGVIELPRQVWYLPERAQHLMPGNQLLPAHRGMVITRGLQEWACLLAQDLPFETAARVLGWQTGTPAVLSSSSVRTLVRQHGRIIQATAEAEVSALLAQEEGSTGSLLLVPHEQARLRAGWPAELNAAVEQALATEQPHPPAGVSRADWERVLTARRQEQALSIEQLRRLGPQLEANQVLLATDEVLTRQVEPRRFWELRTARLTTTEGYRYLCGLGPSFIQLLLLSVLVGVGQQRSLLLLADGARWIREFYDLLGARQIAVQLILDWYHLRHKCYELASRICAGKRAKALFLATLYRALWRGQLDTALDFLHAYAPQAKLASKLTELITYLDTRRAFIVNYRDRHRTRRYIGSAHAEKANDLIVARRQKHQGMHWASQTSLALAALKTLSLNRGWDLYWRDRQVLPLVAPST